MIPLYAGYGVWAYGLYPYVAYGRYLAAAFLRHIIVSAICPSYHRLDQETVAQDHFFYADLFVLIKIEAEHVAFFQMEIV